MKKEDLKSGMLIITSSGKMGLVMIETPQGNNIVGCGGFQDSEIWYPLEALNSDLTQKRETIENEIEIVEVWDYNHNMAAALFSTDGRRLLWKRESIHTNSSPELQDYISKLKKLDLDGEQTQYLLRELCMEDQMLKQLICTEPLQRVLACVADRIELDKK